MGIVQISVALKLFLLEVLVLFKAVNSLMYLQSEVSAFLLFFQDLWRIPSAGVGRTSQKRYVFHTSCFLTWGFWQVDSMISLCPKGLLCFLSPTLAVFFSEAEEESSSSGMSGFDKDDSPKPGLTGQGDWVRSNQNGHKEGNGCVSKGSWPRNSSGFLTKYQLGLDNEE